MDRISTNTQLSSVTVTWQDCEKKPHPILKCTQPQAKERRLLWTRDRQLPYMNQCDLDVEIWIIQHSAKD